MSMAACEAAAEWEWAGWICKKDGRYAETSNWKRASARLQATGWADQSGRSADDEYKLT